ncbi:hypothetical protein E2C01_010961 [Portunus trituberculatus]|uniref:Uncharacterized protein n=1 Tax=Portunus trituberculatus TaxID=210409 RepID=A0A5B7D9R6_PORTR|nr:hypothetical protein [Portunus trituberculatus]
MSHHLPVRPSLRPSPRKSFSSLAALFPPLQRTCRGMQRDAVLPITDTNSDFKRCSQAVQFKASVTAISAADLAAPRYGGDHSGSEGPGKVRHLLPAMSPPQEV